MRTPLRLPSFCCKRIEHEAVLLFFSLFLCAGASVKSAGLASTPSTTVTTGSESAAGLPTPAETPKILHDSIKPPFGLRWGESKEEVGNQLATAGAKNLKQAKVDGREVLAIEGITQPSLQQAIAYFDAQKTLVEVEMQYGDAAWTFDAYRAFVVSVTRSLQAYYGEPTVLARDRRPQGNNIETIAVYQWKQADLSGVLLFFFAVEQGKNRYTTVSVHYRAQLLEPPPAQTPAAIRNSRQKADSD
jgi:hypothetical protein